MPDRLAPTLSMLALGSMLLGGCAAGSRSAVRPTTSPADRVALHAGRAEDAVRVLSARARAGEADAGDLATLGAALELVGRPAEALAALDLAVRAGQREASAEGLLAAEAAAATLGYLEDRAGGYGTVVRRLGADLAGSPSSPRLVGAVQEQRARQARRAGLDEEAEAAVAAAGCLTGFRALGPFGALPLSSFDELHVPGRPGPLPEAAELGPGRGRGRAFEPLVRGCEVELAAPGPESGGTSYAATYVDLGRPQSVVLRVETRASVRVFVNDALVLSQDGRRAFLPTAHEVALQMPAGRSKIVVALTSRYPSPLMRVALTGPRGEPVLEGSAPSSPSGYLPAPPRVLGPASTAARRESGDEYLAAQLALFEGDPERARALLAEAPEPVRTGPLGLVLRATSWAVDRTVPGDVARNRALALLRRASEVEPAAWLPYQELARHHAGEQRYAEALEVIARGTEAAPAEPALRILLASLLTTRGLWRESQDAIGEAARLAPESCRSPEASWALARGRGRADEELAAARELAACDRGSDALALSLLRALRWQEAETELRRLLEREGPRVLVLVGLAEAYRGMGRGADEARALELVLDRSLQDRAALLDLVDLAVSGRGEGGGASELLGRIVTEMRADMLPERRLRSLLEGAEVLEPFRLDGRMAIAAYEAESPSYDVPSVLVLDRTVFRVYADGSIVELTHGITRVLSDEGIELEGEFHVPQGAILLAARTVKADGRVLEPEDIAGKDSLSLPGLEVGDYVETEYLRGHEPPPEFPGGAWPWRFYFQGSRQAFHRSELVVVAPAEMVLEVSRRGAEIPSEERVVGGLRVIRWTARAMGTLPDEPDGPHGDEVVPSVLVTSGASWPAYRAALREALADRDRLSEELVLTARAVVAEAGARSDEDRVSALYRWIAENVEAGSDALDPVSHTLSARTGERTRLLAAMARALGLEAAVGFARATTEDQTEDEVPSLEAFGHPVALVGGRWLHVGPRARWAPVCFVPPDLRGQPVLMADGETLFERLPAEPCVPDRVEVEASVVLAEDGTARASVRETLTGIDAVAWRYRLSRTRQDERAGELEEMYVADALPGGEVTGLEVGGESDPEAPLLLRYEVRGVRLGERRGDELVAVAPFRFELAGLAALPARTTPFVLHQPIARAVRLAVTFPPGAEVVPPEGAVSACGLGEHWSRASVEGGRLAIERELVLRAGRVPPADYPVLAGFLRRVDEVEDAPIRARLSDTAGPARRSTEERESPRSP